ncbi:HNH endonuclease signature motif containing protein [Cumulibacter soli]|uniref:HNH endonuclease signature motif containing protein n=1 Tax=Cumulibacter soli TaxID=2546344 RepID=UPI00106795B1|nr:HNH endonuclease signature motif containing protein [Cumulibacter soli]
MSDTDPLRFVPADTRDVARQNPMEGPRLIAVAEEFSRELSDAFGQLSNGLNALIDIGERGDFAALGPECLLAIAREFEAHRARSVLFDSRVIEAAETEGLAEYAGQKRASIARVLATELKISSREASARARRAKQLLPRNGFSEGEMPPALPALAEAAREGSVTLDNIDETGAAMRRLETIPDIDPSLREQAEQILIAQSASVGPADVRKVGEGINQILVPDGQGPDPEIAKARRGLRVGTRRYDGLYPISGYLTASAKAKLDAVLGPLGAPRPADDGTPDERSAPQRQHDAFEDAMQRLLDLSGVPASGGTSATVHLVIDADRIMRELGLTALVPGDETGSDSVIGSPNARVSGSCYVGRVAGGDRITLDDLKRLAGEAMLIPTWMSESRGIIGYGRSRRVASEGQTLAMIARDGGCSHPGCDAPPDWCQRHHVVEWWRGGDTDIGNMTLVCGRHHRELDSSGWRIDMLDGLPWWTPPPRIDPDRRPILNARIQLPDQEQLDDIARRACAAREAVARSDEQLDPADDLIAFLAAHIDDPPDRDAFHQELAELLASYNVEVARPATATATAAEAVA